MSTTLEVISDEPENIAIQQDDEQKQQNLVKLPIVVAQKLKRERMNRIKILQEEVIRAAKVLSRKIFNF